jgi:hypothetical protein
MISIKIDHTMLSEQIEFLTNLATDIDLGFVVLPEKYSEMRALPSEYIDGVCNLLDVILDEKDKN